MDIDTHTQHLKLHFTRTLNTNRLQQPHITTGYFSEANHRSPTEPAALLGPVPTEPSKLVISKKAWRRKLSPFYSLWLSQLQSLCTMGNGPAISSSHDSWNGTELTAKELSRGCILHMGRMKIVFKDTILARRNSLSSWNQNSGRTQKLLSTIHSAITDSPLNIDSPQCLHWRLVILILKIWKQQQGWENQSGTLLSGFWPLSPFIFDNS